MSITDKIRNAPNAGAVNGLLPDNIGIINSGRRLWTVTEDGEAKGFPESFDDARRRAADLYSTIEEQADTRPFDECDQLDHVNENWRVVEAYEYAEDGTEIHFLANDGLEYDFR